jgi:hypothetical protein
MMRASRPPEHRLRLMPEGRRWGFGAHTVVPYLTMNLHARPGEDAGLTSIRNPVFAQMDKALRDLPQRH